jgi:aspartate carbamoyltransferase catalytic subunit
VNALQYDAEGNLRHLLTLEGMPRARIESLLDRAEALLPHAHGGTGLRSALAGLALCTLFFETSTRTRCSFQLAAQRLGMDVLNFDAGTASLKKGESELDTLNTLAAMGVRAFVVRHARDGAVAELAAGALPGTVLVNGGDGRSNHPTQGLLDMLALRRRLGRDFSVLRVGIVGDVRHSRVARSDIHALTALGCREVRLCGPASLLPGEGEFPGIGTSEDLDATLEGLDAVIMLRLQRERMEQGLVPSLEDYFRRYGLSRERLARLPGHACVLHPGPINRGVEIESTVADGPQSLILEQVACGLPVRMAVLQTLLATSRGPAG